MSTRRLFEKALYVPFVARVCVSVDDLNGIAKKVNEKYKNGNDLYDFFKKRFFVGENIKQWHLSPFGLVWTKEEYFTNYFKADKRVSLRHYIEMSLEELGREETLENIESG